MRIITQRDLIRTVAKRYKDHALSFMTASSADPDAVLLKLDYAEKSKTTSDQLDSLDVEKATAEDVARIIGNESWTSIECGECLEPVTAVILLGEEEGVNELKLCFHCLSRAMLMFAGSKVD